MSVQRKQEAEKQRAKFGRTSSHNLRMGIVGLPNIGKSSLFNVMTGLQVPASNYAFCTIDPTEARVSVQDPRIDTLNAIYKPKKKIPAHLTVFDIAGLVKGASEGLGMGNSFLEHIRQVDGIFHVIRCFKDDAVAHVEDSVDPIRDHSIISKELRAKDLADAKKRREILQREIKAKSNDKALKVYDSALQKLLTGLEEGKEARYIDFTLDEIKSLKPLNLLTAKNVVYLMNISEKMYRERKAPALAAKLKQHLEKVDPDALCVVVCGAVAGEEAKEYVGKSVSAGYTALDLCNFFTCGPDEVRSWTIRKDTLAPDAAAVIHTDFKTGFIAVEAIQYEDIIAHKTENEVRNRGLCKLKGKDYLISDGEILHFKVGKLTAPKKQ